MRWMWSHLCLGFFQQVDLGVLQKNENIKEELLVCMEQYHNLVPEVDGQLQHKFCIGMWSDKVFIQIYGVPVRSLKLVKRWYQVATYCPFYQICSANSIKCTNTRACNILWNLVSHDMPQGQILEVKVSCIGLWNSGKMWPEMPICHSVILMD